MTNYRPNPTSLCLNFHNLRQSEPMTLSETVDEVIRVFKETHPESVVITLQKLPSGYQGNVYISSDVPLLSNYVNAKGIWKREE